MNTTEDLVAEARSAQLCGWCDRISTGFAYRTDEHTYPERSCGQDGHGYDFLAAPQVSADLHLRLADALEKAESEAATWKRRCAEETLAWVEATKRADIAASASQPDLIFGSSLKHCSCLSSFDGEGDGRCELHSETNPGHNPTQHGAES